MRWVGMMRPSKVLKGIRHLTEGIWRKKKIWFSIGKTKETFLVFLLKGETDFDKENRTKAIAS